MSLHQCLVSLLPVVKLSMVIASSERKAIFYAARGQVLKISSCIHHFTAASYFCWLPALEIVIQDVDACAAPIQTFDGKETRKMFQGNQSNIIVCLLEAAVTSFVRVVKDENKKLTTQLEVESVKKVKTIEYSSHSMQMVMMSGC